MLPGELGMRQSGFRAWVVLGGLAAALLGVGCGRLPDTGGTRPDDPHRNFFETEGPHHHEDYWSQFHYSANRGYNGTIQDVGSSIDPRTPQATGRLNNSRQVDVTGRPAPSTSETEIGIGGSGNLGEPKGPSDLGWRSRRGFDLRPTHEFGSYGPGARR
jgi:hypothetical protein